MIEEQKKIEMNKKSLIEKEKETPFKPNKKKDSISSLSTCVTNWSCSNSIKSKNNKNEKLYNVDFFWKDEKQEATEVLLAGNFISWNNKFIMKRQDKLFKVSLKLHKGIYKYKYIVDNKWKISENETKIIEPNGVVNNTISVPEEIININKDRLLPSTERNNEKVESIKNRRTDGNNSLIFVKENISNNISNIPKKEEKEKLYEKEIAKEIRKKTNEPKKKKLKEKVPKKEEIFDCLRDSSLFKKEPPKAPGLYAHDYFLRNLNEFRNENTNYGVLSFGKVPHIFYNHLMFNKIELNETFFNFSLTKRTKSKLLTFAYYTPANKKK